MIRTESLSANDGARLNLLRAGPADQSDLSNTTVLLIPGWCMPATIWRDTLLALAPEHELVAMDPRGQGDSEISERGYHIDQRADDIAQCIANAVDPAARLVIAGWSLGALEVLHYVRRYGESRLAGVVLIDSSVGEEPAIPAAQGFRNALNVDRRATMEQFVRAMFHSPQQEAMITNLIERTLRLPLESCLALFPSHVPRENWRETARALRAPLLYAVTPQFAAQAENLVKARPATQIEIFAGAGHALFVDEPGRFNRLLAEFIDRLDGGNGPGVECN